MRILASASVQSIGMYLVQLGSFLNRVQRQPTPLVHVPIELLQACMK